MAWRAIDNLIATGHTGWRKARKAARQAAKQNKKMEKQYA
jgi:hypothetical protein